MLVPRVCDGSALGEQKADFDITDILKSGGSDLGEAEQTADKRIDPNKTQLIEMLMKDSVNWWKTQLIDERLS